MEDGITPVVRFGKICVIVRSWITWPKKIEISSDENLGTIVEGMLLFDNRNDVALIIDGGTLLRRHFEGSPSGFRVSVGLPRGSAGVAVVKHVRDAHRHRIDSHPWRADANVQRLDTARTLIWRKKIDKKI